MTYPRFAIILVISMVSTGCLEPEEGGPDDFNEIEVDRITIIHGVLSVTMNYTSERPPKTLEKTIQLFHCGLHNWEAGHLIAYVDNWDTNISTLIMMDYRGDYYLPFSGGGDDRLSHYLSNSTPVEIMASMNSSLSLFRVGPEIDGFIEPLEPTKKVDGNWTSSYIIHDYEDTNITYLVEETLQFKVYTDVPVYRRYPYACL